MGFLEGFLEVTVPAAAQAMTWRGDPALAVVMGLGLWVIGAALASFSGLVADRLPGIMGFDEDDGRGLCTPPSACDGCGSRIGPVALLPVIGWLACRGRCAGCGSRVSPVYPGVEAAAGTASVLIPPLVGDPAIAVAALALLWTGVLLAWCDIRHHILPEAVTVPLVFAGLLLSPFEPDPWMRSAGAAAAAAAVWLSFAAISRLKRVDAFSGGDVALAAAGGAWLGLGGLSMFLAATSIAFVAYAVPGRMRGTVWVPMGPALALALLGCAVAQAA